MADCPNCNVNHTHDELELVKSFSTGDSTYAYLKCPSCQSASDYSEWNAFSALYD